MGLQIVVLNKLAIEAELLAVNGKATSFTLTAFSDVEKAAKDAEARLVALPKAQRRGATCIYQPAGPSAKSYRYKAKSTQVHLIRKSAGWYLIGVHEAWVYPRANRKLIVEISGKQAKEIQRRAVADFVVRQTAAPNLTT